MVIFRQFVGFHKLYGNVRQFYSEVRKMDMGYNDLPGINERQKGKVVFNASISLHIHCYCSVEISAKNTFVLYKLARARFTSSMINLSSESRI